jgi:hypothetical protein
VEIVFSNHTKYHLASALNAELKEMLFSWHVDWPLFVLSATLEDSETSNAAEG